MLDVDIAALYGVPTKRLNEQVKRSSERFPADLMFRLNSAEWAALMWSQIATRSTQRRRRLDQPPYAFTEHGCLMLANVLKSKLAIQVSLMVIRAFVRLRTILAADRGIAARVDELSRALGRQGKRLSTHERAILRLLEDIRRLTRFPEHRPRPIGFTANIDGDPS